MAPGLAHKIVGIRPGEKMHEIMCPADDSPSDAGIRRSLRDPPTINFADRDNCYPPNRVGETATRVAQGFEYNSGHNSRFLDVERLSN